MWFSTGWNNNRIHQKRLPETIRVLEWKLSPLASGRSYKCHPLKKKKREAPASWYYERSFLVHNLKSWHNSIAVTWDPEKKKTSWRYFSIFPMMFSLLKYHPSTYLTPSQLFHWWSNSSLANSCPWKCQGTVVLARLLKVWTEQIVSSWASRWTRNICSKMLKKLYVQKESMSFKICLNRFTKSTCLPILRGH